MTTRQPFVHPFPGSPFEPIAVEHAEFIDAALAHRDGPASDPISDPGAGARVVLMQNVSGVDVEWGGCLGIGTAVLSPGTASTPGEFARRLLIEGDTPTDEEHRGHFAIALETIKDGALGRVVIGGLAMARLDVKDTNDRYADIEDGVYFARSVPNGGARIIAKGTGTGKTWAWIDLAGARDSARRFPAKITAIGTPATNKVPYTFAEVTPTSGTGLAAFTTVTGGRTGTAYNTREAGNTATVVGGVDTDGDAYPSGFAPVWTDVNAIVEITQRTKDDGTTLYTFQDGPTAHDGDCG